MNAHFDSDHCNGPTEKEKLEESNEINYVVQQTF